MLAQSAPPSCPAQRPVDDIITEVHKQQSKKKNRNKNPFPDVTCIWGWCRDKSSNRTPPTFPDPGPPQLDRGNESTSSGHDSTSRNPVDDCNDAMEMALKAAHDVEVGDEYFAAKSYDAALLRYKDAAEEKPGDAAIHVRLGRVFAKLGQIPQAIEQYKAAQELAGPAKWSHEAEEALLRLQHRSSPDKH